MHFVKDFDGYFIYKIYTRMHILKNILCYTCLRVPTRFYPSYALIFILIGLSSHACNYRGFLFCKKTTIIVRL
jgi:hypothetical protein